jgi:hypothetical protein
VQRTAGTGMTAGQAFAQAPRDLGRRGSARPSSGPGAFRRVEGASGAGGVLASCLGVPRMVTAGFNRGCAPSASAGILGPVDGPPPLRSGRSVLWHVGACEGSSPV